MEIKAKLFKPCTSKERMSFIVEQNHRNGFIIEEREDAIVALGLTKEEESKKRNEARIAEIKSRLEKIDLESTRPLRAIVSNTATESDRLKLIELEEEANELRDELRRLS